MKAKGELTAAINSQEKVDPYHLDSLLIGETLVDSAGDKEWGQLYFIDESQKKVFLITPVNNENTSSYSQSETSDYFFLSQKRA